MLGRLVRLESGASERGDNVPRHTPIHVLTFFTSHRSFEYVALSKVPLLLKTVQHRSTVFFIYPFHTQPAVTLLFLTVFSPLPL